jgi:acetyl esterase/lipase
MSAQLDPQAQDLIDLTMAAGLPSLHELSVEEARERMRSVFVEQRESPSLLGVEDVVLPSPSGELRLRLYRPGAGILPVALFLHGGGWTLNDLDTHDRVCRLIASRSNWLLASLDYRRAPEHRHPAVLEDAQHGFRWLLDNSERIGADTGHTAVIGESSGGTTAAALSLLLRDAGAILPGYQILAYPATDFHDRWPSYDERGSGYTLDRDSLRWFFDNYLPPAGWDLEDPYLFPMAACDLSGLPPTLIMTAEFDPLRDEGVAFADKLAAAGVPVEHLHAEDQMHGFLLLDRGIARAGELIGVLADALAARVTVAAAERNSG